jgi:hypothetical protein
MSSSRKEERMSVKLALNAEIQAQIDPDVVRNPRSIANTATTEWNIGSGTGPGGTFQEHWPSHLPRPPSRRNLVVEDDDAANPNTPRVVVFHANTEEGSSLVRVLSEKGLRVVAVVRVTSNRNTKKLIKLKHVTVKVADLNNYEAVKQASQGCQQAFLVCKYWERFESPIEEGMARVVVEACQATGVKRLVLAAFEDTTELRVRGRKSQIVPTVDGRIFPNFDGMAAIDAQAKASGVQLTHMFTSYLDETDAKKSLVLLRGENGKIICQSHIIQDAKSRN